MASISRQKLETGILNVCRNKGMPDDARLPVERRRQTLFGYLESIPLDDGSDVKLDPDDAAEFALRFYNVNMPLGFAEKLTAKSRFKGAMDALVKRLESAKYNVSVIDEAAPPSDVGEEAPAKRQDSAKTAALAAALDMEAPGAGRVVKWWAERKAAKEAKKAAEKQAEAAEKQSEAAAQERAQDAGSNHYGHLTDGGGMVSSARDAYWPKGDARHEEPSDGSGFFSRFFTKEDIPSEDAHVHWLKRLLFAIIVFGTMIAIFFTGWSTYTIAGLILIVLSFLGAQVREEFIFTKIGLAAIILLLSHAAIARAGFKLDPVIITIIISAYFIAIVLTIFSRNREYNISMMTLLLGATILLYALPYLSQRFIGSAEITNAVIFVVTLLPIWALFYIHQVSQQYEKGYASGLKMWYAFVIAGIVLIAGLGGLWGIAPRLPNFDTGVDAQEGVKAAGGTIVERFTTNLKKVVGMYDRATDPGAYYTGKVEENKKKPNGVTIEGFRPQDKTVNNESEVIVHGVVNARSFMGSAITVQPACLIDRKGAPEASVDPPITEVIYGTGQTFTCTFPPLANGQYSVKGSATFPFETWAYIEYTFVDEERARNLARQQLDVNTELDIPETPTAIFTSGPVLVGMGGSTQPILIKPEGPKLVQPGTKIGITIDPAWESGKLQRVDRIELKVPKPFVIAQDSITGAYKCDRNLSQAPEQDIYESEYTNYVFDNPNYGPLTTYTSLTCTIDILNPDDARLLVSERDKTVRSFIAVAHYTYTVETKTSVLVK